MFYNIYVYVYKHVDQASKTAFQPTKAEINFRSVGTLSWAAIKDKPIFRIPNLNLCESLQSLQEWRSAWPLK